MPSPLTSRPSSLSSSQVDTSADTQAPREESGRAGRASSPASFAGDRNPDVTRGLARRSGRTEEQQRRPLTQATLPQTTAATATAAVASGSRARGSGGVAQPAAVTPEQMQEARQGMLEAMERVPGEGKEMAFVKALFNAPISDAGPEQSGEALRRMLGAMARVPGEGGEMAFIKHFFNAPASDTGASVASSAEAKGKQPAARASASMQAPRAPTDNSLALVPYSPPLTRESFMRTVATTRDALVVDVPPEERRAAEAGGTAINDFVAKGAVSATATSESRAGASDNERAITRLSQDVIAEASTMVGHDASPEARSTAVSVTMVRRLSQAYGAAKAFSGRIAENDFESGTANLAASVANVGTRNALSVLLPTTARQMISYGIEKGLTDSHVSDHGRIALGTAVALLPVALHLVGALRDGTAHTQTATSARSRAIMGGLTLAAVVAGLGTGVMRETAVQIVAFTIYTAMRDLLVQSRVKLENVNSSGDKPDAKHFGAISIGYGIDQGLVNLAMSTKASPSGPSAFIHKAGLRPDNAVRRGGINYAGEIAEDLMFNAIPAVREGHPLQLALKDAGWTKNGLANAALGPWAVRSGILGMSLIGSNIIAQHLGAPAYSPAVLEGVSDMFYAMLNGILYEPFANAGSAQPQPETAHDDEAASMTTLGSRHSYQSPDVVMTNEASLHPRDGATPRPSNV